MSVPTTGSILCADVVVVGMFVVIVICCAIEEGCMGQCTDGDGCVGGSVDVACGLRIVLVVCFRNWIVIFCVVFRLCVHQIIILLELVSESALVILILFSCLFV